jgi:hypothetical protein
MPDITVQSRLSLDPRVRFRRFENDGIVIHQKTAEAIVVSDVGTRLLELTDGARTLHECAQAMQSEFDAPAHVIEHDLLQFASELASLGIVTVTP